MPSRGSCRDPARIGDATRRPAKETDLAKMGIGTV
jgi:hypothetical protein